MSHGFSNDGLDGWPNLRLGTTSVCAAMIPAESTFHPTMKVDLVGSEIIKRFCDDRRQDGR
jgi:hypothetical protein